MNAQLIVCRLVAKCILLALLLQPSDGFAQNPSTNVTAGDSLASTNGSTQPVGSLRANLERLYREAFNAGTNALNIGRGGATNYYGMAEEDLRKEGTYDYRIEVVTNASPDSLDRCLKPLGQDRWELIWVRESKDGVMLLFKRRYTSILREIIKGRVP